MSTQLPTHLGGLQHLAPEVIIEGTDIVVREGKPTYYVHETALGGAMTVQDAEAILLARIYRRIPCPRQGGERPESDLSVLLRDAERELAAHNEVARKQEEQVNSIVRGTLTTDAKARKATPIYSGFLKYFPLAIAEVARVSQAGNDQHNPGKPLHWDRSKSGDELDADARHLLEAGTFDTDGQRHSAKHAWRAMANLQKELEAEQAAGEKK